MKELIRFIHLTKLEGDCWFHEELGWFNDLLCKISIRIQMFCILSLLFGDKLSPKKVH